jgi:hypothetical protein
VTGNGFPDGVVAGGQRQGDVVIRESPCRLDVAACIIDTHTGRRHVNGRTM